MFVQAVRPELADKDEHEDQTGLESLMEGDQKHHTQLPGATADGMCYYTHVHVHVHVRLMYLLKDMVCKVPKYNLPGIGHNSCKTLSGVHEIKSALT